MTSCNPFILETLRRIFFYKCFYCRYVKYKRFVGRRLTSSASIRFPVLLVHLLNIDSIRVLDDRIFDLHNKLYFTSKILYGLNNQ